MTIRATADVLVVGGGPAGAWSAWSLATRGARVRVFDHSHPREKPCGGGVTGRALALVSPAVDAATLGGVTVTRGLFDDPRTEPSWVELDHLAARDASLVVVPRSRFDWALLQAASASGAEHHAERVLDVDHTRGRPRVTTTAGVYEGDWLIGADGANSLVRRRVQHAFRRDQLSLASGVYAHGCTDTSIVVRFVSEPPGYIWSFPRADHLAIGIGTQADEATAATLRATLDRWLTSSGLARGARLQRYAWPIPSLSALDLEREWPAGRNYLLVGDAAGLVDPITREGIYFSLLSGRYAAEAIASHLRPDLQYVSTLRAEVYPELMRAARLKRGFFRSAFTRMLVDALRESAAIRAVMVDLVAGLQPYRGLKTRLLRTFEWPLLWQLLLLETGFTRRYREHPAGVT